MKKEGTLLEAKYQWSMTNGRSNEVNHRTKRMYRMLIFAAFLILHSSFLVSCSESDNSVEEYPNWKEKNENYFNNLYTQTELKVANYDKDWKILTKWSMQDSISKRPYDHIIVHVLKEGTELLFAGDPEIIRSAFGFDDLRGNHVFLSKVLSRKKQIVPALSQIWG